MLRDYSGQSSLSPAGGGGGLQVDGQSHVVHSEEEAMGTRLTVDSLTCLLANQVGPRRCCPQVETPLSTS